GGAEVTEPSPQRKPARRPRASAARLRRRPGGGNRSFARGLLSRARKGPGAQAGDQRAQEQEANTTRRQARGQGRVVQVAGGRGDGRGAGDGVVEAVGQDAGPDRAESP